MSSAVPGLQRLTQTQQVGAEGVWWAHRRRPLSICQAGVVSTDGRAPITIATIIRGTCRHPAHGFPLATLPDPHDIQRLPAPSWFILSFLYILAAPDSMGDFSPLTRDRT